MGRRTFVYVRGNGQQCDEQVEIIRAFCERDGQEWDTVRVFRDQGFSGFTRFASRPAAKKLWEILREGDTLIIESVSRISRNIVDLVSVLTTLSASEVRLHIEGSRTTYELDQATLRLIEYGLRALEIRDRFDD